MILTETTMKPAIFFCDQDHSSEIIQGHREGNIRKRIKNLIICCMWWLMHTVSILWEAKVGGLLKVKSLRPFL